MRLIDADALRKNMEFICMGIMAGTEPYNAPLTEIDNAQPVEIATKLQPNCNNLQQGECENCDYYKGFRDGYAQCINDKEERKENNRLFQKGDAENG